MTNIGMKVQGVAKVQVLSKGIIVEERPWTKNLVLTQGKDAFFGGSYWMCELIKYCAAGSGTATPVSTDVSLQSEITRTGTLLTGAGNTGRTIHSDGRVVYKYTHDFAVETVNKNYSELGWSWSASAGNNLFSRVLISGGTVTILSGQQLRVVYELTITVTPAAVPQAASLTISGWPVAPATSTAGEFKVCYPGFAYLGTDGSVGNNGAELFEPKNSVSTFDVCSDLTLTAFAPTYIPCTVIYSAFNTISWGSYTPGSFTRSRVVATISAAAFASTSIKAFKYGQSLAFVFTDNQTKSNLHRLKPNGFSVTLS